MSDIDRLWIAGLLCLIFLLSAVDSCQSTDRYFKHESRISVLEMKLDLHMAKEQK